MNGTGPPQIDGTSHSILEFSPHSRYMRTVVRIPRAFIPAVAVTIAGVIAYAVTGGRIGTAVVALGVIWIMRAVRSQS
jgi:hypothetical protein